MKTTTALCRIATLSLLLGAGGAAVAEDDDDRARKPTEPTVKRIVRGGGDGERTFYTVSCLNGERLSVYVEHATDLTCAVPRNSKPACKKDGALQSAAEQACKASPRG